MSQNPDQDPNFEQAMERLEEIVAAMEGERLMLDEMVGNYEEGMRLLKVCRQRLDSARRRVEIISAEAEGRVTLAAFEPAAVEESGDDKSKPASRRRPKPEAEDQGGDIRLF
jgi:exodeoxyribonuclease VII small subunit